MFRLSIRSSVGRVVGFFFSPAFASRAGALQIRLSLLLEEGSAGTTLPAMNYILITVVFSVDRGVSS